MLSICIKFRNNDAMRFLISCRAEVNVRGASQPPLLMACYYNNAEAVAILCQNGADTRMENTYGARPLNCAVMGASRTGWDALSELLTQQAGQPDLSDFPMIAGAVNGTSGQAILRCWDVFAYIFLSFFSVLNCFYVSCHQKDRTRGNVLEWNVTRNPQK